MTLYQFESLDKKLDELGFPKIKAGKGYQAIRTDFKRAYDEGKIEFRDDGIYLIHDGHEYRGYMYMPTYRVSKYDSFSRFHLTRCDTIEKFISRGMFNTFYKWSNHEMNDIEDRDTSEIHENITMNLCSNCKSEIFNEIDDTKDFFNELDKSEFEEDVQVDILGYVKGKEIISKTYREKQGFICESCLVQPRQSFHKRWWHVHHIDGNKTNNKESNLECLCIVCHAFKNKRHEDNFSKGRMKIQIGAFYNEYKAELEKVNNPYLKKL